MRQTGLFLLAFLPLWGSMATAGQVSLVVHPNEGTYDVRAVDPDVGSLTGARLGLDVDGKTLWAGEAKKVAFSGDASGKLAPGQTVTASYEFDAPRLDWLVEFQVSADGTAATVVSEIRNRGVAPLKLGKCRLADLSANPSGLSLGDAPEETVMLVFTGWGLQNLVQKVSGNKALTGKTLAPLFNAKSQTSLLLGFLTFDRLNTEHQAEWAPESKGIVLQSYCDFEGYTLAKDQGVRSEKLMVAFSHDPQQAMRGWADAVAAHYKPRICPDTPAGWVGWAWVDGFGVERYEDIVRRNASAIARRLPGLGVEYVWLSIGNLKGRIPGNWLQWNSECFPTPPEKFAGDLRQQGFKLGLWMGSFWMCTAADPEQVANLKDALLTRDGKPVMAGQQWGYAAGTPDMFILDPTHPKTQAFLRETLQTYYRWGVRYYMIDFLYAISGSTPGAFPYDEVHDRSLIHGPEVYRAGLKLVREAAGPDTYLQSSTGPTIQNVGLLDGCRMGYDYGEGRPLMESGTAGTFNIHQPNAWPTSHMNATTTLATTGFMHRKLFVADTANVMTVDKPCPLNEAQITATIFGINGGPIMLGDDIDRMSEDRLRLVQQCLPRMPEAAYAVDLFDCPSPDHAKIFHLPIQTAWDRWDLVALFNYSDVSRDATIDLKRIGLDPAAEYLVWNFWNERCDGICKATLQMTAAPQSVTLLRLSAKRPHPWLVSTDMHVRQGQAEIEDCQWDPATTTLKFRAKRPAGQSGSVFFSAPAGWRVATPSRLWLASDARNQSLTMRCDLDFTGETVEKAIRFEAVKK